MKKESKPTDRKGQISDGADGFGDIQEDIFLGSSKAPKDDGDTSGIIILVAFGVLTAFLMGEASIIFIGIIGGVYALGWLVGVLLDAWLKKESRKNKALQSRPSPPTNAAQQRRAPQAPLSPKHVAPRPSGRSGENASTPAVLRRRHESPQAAAVAVYKAEMARVQKEREVLKPAPQVTAEEKTRPFGLSVKGTPAPLALSAQSESAPLQNRASASPEERGKIERAAVRTVTRFLEAKGFAVKSVESKNCGWDLEARTGDSRMLVEVKGNKGADIYAELTPNEYAKTSVPGFYLAVVRNALRSPACAIYRKHGDEWQFRGGDDKGAPKRLVTAERVSAVVTPGRE